MTRSPYKTPDAAPLPEGQDDWRRTYWVVWIANLVTSIGMMSFLPFFPSLLEEMGVADPTARARWAGVCFAAAPLSATVSAPIWGAIGDRFGRKIMVCRAMVAIAVFVGGMGLVQAPWQLLAMRLGQGMFSGFIPPSITLVSVAAPETQQGRIAGNLATALAIGGLTGPLFGGFLQVQLGAQQPVFFVVGTMALVSAIFVWFGAHEDKAKRRGGGEKRPGKAIRQTLSDVGEVFRNPAMRATALVVFALQFGLGAVNPVLELHIQDLFGPGLEGTYWETLADRFGKKDMPLEVRVETLATSLCFGAMAVASLMALSPWGRYGDRIGHGPALVRCAVVALLALFVQGAVLVYFVLLIGRFLMGVGMAGIGPLAFGLAAGEASADRRGGAFGVVFSARTFAVAIGGTAGGLMYPYLGLRGILAVSGALLLGTLMLFRASAGSRATASARTHPR